MPLLSRSLCVAVGVLLATQAAAQISFYERDQFRGQSFSTQKTIHDFSRFGFNDRSSSAEVTSGRWEVCEDSDFNGRCVVLRQGVYPSLAAMGLNKQVSSLRPLSQNTHVETQRYAPLPTANPPDYRLRQNERLYQARVSSVRAVVGPPEQRCWVEREQLPMEQRSSQLMGPMPSAPLGSVLGHQVGDSTDSRLVTPDGAAASAAMGSQVERTTQTPSVPSRQLQRCQEVPSQSAPEFWDVSYNFRGQDHHVQLQTVPGDSITVNRRGEPRS